MNTNLELPVKVLKGPHWRVNIRPETYEPQRVPSLGACFEHIEKTSVRLRGWDYPHLSHRNEERAQGNTWVASWCAFRGHTEYWRLYQSGQFIHLYSVREATEPGWKEKLAAGARAQCIEKIDWTNVPGFISFENFIYGVTEIFEFAARLSQRGLYKGQLEIAIAVKGIKGFVLTTGPERCWSKYHAASADLIENSWKISSDELVASSAQKSLAAMEWFFERLGWLSPEMVPVRKEQEKFLARRS